MPLPASTFGAAALAVVINLLAAGGIGFPAVAMALWLLVALGLNLREDRGCSRLHEVDSPIPGFALAFVWAALVGLVCRGDPPFWRPRPRSPAPMTRLRHQPPDFDRAQAAYRPRRRPTATMPGPGWATPISSS